MLYNQLNFFSPLFSVVWLGLIGEGSGKYKIAQQMNSETFIIAGTSEGMNWKTLKRKTLFDI